MGNGNGITPLDAYIPAIQVASHPKTKAFHHFSFRMYLIKKVNASQGKMAIPNLGDVKAAHIKARTRKIKLPEIKIEK